MGIDPGIRVTGYGIVDSNGQESRHVASGVIKTNKASGVGRLEVIFRETGALVAEYAPAELSIERVFLHHNADSALKLGQARAAAIAATFAGSLNVFEYAAREVKQSIVGQGSAGKEQVQHMVRILLNLNTELQLDQSDALAVALCHAHRRASNLAIAEAAS